MQSVIHFGSSFKLSLLQYDTWLKEPLQFVPKTLGTYIRLVGIPWITLQPTSPTEDKHFLELIFLLDCSEGEISNVAHGNGGCGAS